MVQVRCWGQGRGLRDAWWLLGWVTVFDGCFPGNVFIQSFFLVYISLACLRT